MLTGMVRDYYVLILAVLESFSVMAGLVRKSS